jgi:surface antigen
MIRVRLIILAMTALVVAGCASRDERSRLGDLVDGDSKAETVAVAAPVDPVPATLIRESTLILASLLASEAGQAITAADQLALERTTQTTLETVPIGTESTWRNPQTGSHGIVAPHRTFQKSSGTYCREFTQSLVTGNVTEEALGTACRETDGTWKLADN